MVGDCQGVDSTVPQNAGGHAGSTSRSSNSALWPSDAADGPGRALEGTVVKRLSDREVQDYEAVRAAIRETAKMENGEARLAVIDLLYWKQYWKTIDGAAYEVGYSTDRAKEIHGEFIRLVGFCLGYLPREKVRKRRNVTPQSQNPVLK